MLERELGLARERAPLARHEQVLLAQRAQRPRRSPPSASATGTSASSQNVRPTTAACASRRRWNGSSESSRAASSACTVAGQLGRAARLLLGEAPDHLLGEQRVALGARGDGRDHAPRLPSTVSSSSDDQLARLLLAERVEEERGRVAADAAPAGPALEQLVAREADLQHRRAHPLHEVLDQVEHALVGPVDVLPDRARADARGRAPRRTRGPRRRTLRACAGRPRARPRVPRRPRPRRRPRCRAGERSASPSRWRSALQCPRARSAARRAGRRACATPRRGDRRRRSRTRHGSPRRAASRRCSSRTAGSAPAARAAAARVRADPPRSSLHEARLADAGFADSRDEVRAAAPVDAVEGLV